MGDPGRRPDLADAVSAGVDTGLQAALDELSAVGASRVDPQDPGKHSRLVTRYYDAVTRFYEFGWGTSFHFSPRRRGENLAQAQRRHERDIAKLLQLRTGMRVADIGCGVGGPLISIASATGATITGININARQLARAEQLLRKAGAPGDSGFLLADFLDVPVEDSHFDALYSLEAIMQSPDVGGVFAEAFRMLRAGGELAVVDWCLTDRFDARSRHHRLVRARLENLNATPHLLTTAEQVKAVASAGFEILASRDQAMESDAETPWYRSLQGRDIGVSSLARIPISREVTATVTSLLEHLRVVPRGTTESARVLNRAADALVEAGKLGIFTPSFLVHARKSEQAPG